MAGRRGQRWLTQAERLEIRRRVATGEPFGSIATSIGRTTRTIHNIIARDGSVPPRDSVRSSLRLSIAEREEISRGLRGGESLRRIAVRLGRSTSTVSREVAGNGGRRRYRAHLAEVRTAARARRPRRAKLARNRSLCRNVERLLEARWSPQQIAWQLRHDHPDEREMRVSHETIYQSLFV
jgi:IS30 family transposase